MAGTTININVNNGKDINAELEKAYAAADSIINHLFFLQETFRELSNPNIDKIEFSPFSLSGLYEILETMTNKAMDVTEALNNAMKR